MRTYETTGFRLLAQSRLSLIPGNVATDSIFPPLTVASLEGSPLHGGPFLTPSCGALVLTSRGG